MLDPSLDSFHICLMVSNQTAEIVYLSTSLIYDGIAFFLTFTYSFKSLQTFRASNLMGALLRDGTLYFFIIFTSNFVWLMSMVLFDVRDLYFFPRLMLTIFFNSSLY